MFSSHASISTDNEAMSEVRGKAVHKLWNTFDETLPNKLGLFLQENCTMLLYMYVKILV